MNSGVDEVLKIKEEFKRIVFFLYLGGAVFCLVLGALFLLLFNKTRFYIKNYKNKQLQEYRLKFKKPFITYKQSRMTLPLWETLKWYFPLFASVLFFMVAMIFFIFLFNRLS